MNADHYFIGWYAASMCHLIRVYMFENRQKCGRFDVAALLFIWAISPILMPIAAAVWVSKYLRGDYDQ